MSRNMLMFEDSERKKFGISFLRLKLKSRNWKKKPKERSNRQIYRQNKTNRKTNNQKLEKMFSIHDGNNFFSMKFREKT